MLTSIFHTVLRGLVPYGELQRNLWTIYILEEYKCVEHLSAFADTVLAPKGP